MELAGFPEDFTVASDDTKVFALLCAVVHHGLANLANDSIPPGARKVIETATTFEGYLNDT